MFIRSIVPNKKDLCAPTKSNLYFDSNFTNVISEPAPYRLLTLHAPYLMTIFLRLGRLFRDYIKFLGLVKQVVFTVRSC
jgi:hypothetical protein